MLLAETGALLESQLASWLLWGGRRPADLLVLDARMHAMEGMHLLLALARMGCASAGPAVARTARPHRCGAVTHGACIGAALGL